MIVGRTPPQRIFVDCSRTFHANAHTGVDRMVRGLVKAMATVGPRMGMRCTPVIFQPRRGFVALTPQIIARRFGALGPSGAETDGVRVFAHRLLERFGLLDAARVCKGALKKISSAAQTGLRAVSRSGVTFERGDILVLLDVAWDAPYWNDLRRAQHNGVEVCQCVHDLILLNHPECVAPKVTAKFDGWWRQISAVADYLICISRATWDEVCEYHTRRPPENDARLTPLCSSFRLGADLDRMYGTTAVRRELRDLFEGWRCEKIYLQVGLISPRKNYDLALDALERSWNAGVSVALVIVGKYGWACDELLRRITTHPEFGKRLFWFENVGDDELDYCYRRATALLTTSYAEGFNLPIVEALSRGTTVIATDLPTHREVAGRFAAYFPAADAAALDALIRAQAADGALPQVASPDEFHWLDWNDSCAELLRELGELSRSLHAGSAGKPRMNPAA